MSKHTQGPWGFDDSGIYEVIGDKLMAINGKDGMKIAWIEEGPDQLADARLIAAAPELLEACKAILSRAASTAVAYGLLRNAIAKAEGGAK